MKNHVLLTIIFLGFISCDGGKDRIYKRSAIDFLKIVKDQSLDSISAHFWINPSENIMFPVDVKNAKAMLSKHGSIYADSLFLDSSRTIDGVRRMYLVRLYNKIDGMNEYLGLIRVSFPDHYPGKVSVFEVVPKSDYSIRINADSIRKEVLKRHGYSE